MNAVLKKLQFKDQNKIYVLGLPRELKPLLDDMANYVTVKKNPTCKQEYEFALFFVKSCADVAKYAQKAAQKVLATVCCGLPIPKNLQKIIKRTSHATTAGSLLAISGLKACAWRPSMTTGRHCAFAASNLLNP